jgi:hypothetical protein
VDPDLRTALLAAGLIFCVGFGLMTVSVIARQGLDILSLTSFLVIAMIGAGLIGAIRNPPRD